MLDQLSPVQISHRPEDIHHFGRCFRLLGSCIAFSAARRPGVPTAPKLAQPSLRASAYSPSMTAPLSPTEVHLMQPNAQTSGARGGERRSRLFLESSDARDAVCSMYAKWQKKKYGKLTVKRLQFWCPRFLVFVIPRR